MQVISSGITIHQLNLYLESVTEEVKSMHKGADMVREKEYGG